MTASPAPEVPTARWRRWLEWLLFAGAVATGGCLVAVGLTLQSVERRSMAAVATVALERPVAAVAVLLVGTLVGLVWTLALAAALYLDAAAIEEAGAREWNPRGSAYAALVLAVPVAALHYLRRRHRQVGTAPRRRRWWLGFPLGSAALVLPFVAVSTWTLPPAAVLVGPGLSLAFFPAAAYRDAEHVLAAGGNWRPDPAVHFVVAVVTTLLVFPQPLYTGYYLLRRRRAGTDR